jgi:hypothetical protein
VGTLVGVRERSDDFDDFLNGRTNGQGSDRSRYEYASSIPDARRQREAVAEWSVILICELVGVFLDVDSIGKYEH